MLIYGICSRVKRKLVKGSDRCWASVMICLARAGPSNLLTVQCGEGPTPLLSNGLFLLLTCPHHLRLLHQMLIQPNAISQAPPTGAPPLSGLALQPRSLLFFVCLNIFFFFNYISQHFPLTLQYERISNVILWKLWKPCPTGRTT